MTRTHCLTRFVLVTLITILTVHPLCLAQRPDDFTLLERQFRELPMTARRQIGPLFWLHGDESPQQLTAALEKVAQGGNGCFTAESRPHSDWLGPNWFRDLGVCLDEAKRLDLRMWIFDERWWPSGEVGGMVPKRYASKYLQSDEREVHGPQSLSMPVPEKARVAVLAGRMVGGAIDGESLIDLAPGIRRGRIEWNVPPGTWKVMTFTWRTMPARRRGYLVDGASRDAVDWYIRTVYQPHYDHFSNDFGGTIVGYFYDEPETHGDWGDQVIPMLMERGVDWEKALVAWKFKLADPDQQVAARYQYQDAFAEAWGRTLFGGISRWCREHRVQSIGHFLEHNHEYLNPRECAGNMFQLQKYSDMGAIDAVFKQFAPGHKDDSTYQTPKLGSSISHAYGKTDDLAMVEIFGARGQDLTYPEMKWWTDHMQVSGINFHIPHSFNPRAPYDRDCPPYFYNGGEEPRWPLYRVYADYTARVSLMLTGGRHVCPVAFLFLGNSAHVGDSTTPETMTTALQDALFDCDWLPYDVFENDCRVADSQLLLRQERYRVVVVPAAEVIPYRTLAKVRAFFDAGGIVVGYGMLPGKSADLDRGSDDIATLRHAIWGEVEQPSTKIANVNTRGGRAYFLPRQPTPNEIQSVLVRDAGIHPSLEVIAGETDNWLHILHRIKAGRDIFFICNQNTDDRVRRFTFRAAARGVPECWDPMRNEINTLAFERIDPDTVEFALELAPLESVLIVFQPKALPRPARLTADIAPTESILVSRIDTRPAPASATELEQSQPSALTLDGCSWVWLADGDPTRAAPVGVRYFRSRVSLPPGRKVAEATMLMSADNNFVLYVNGEEAGRSEEAGDNWRWTRSFDLARLLRGGVNTLAIAARNSGEAPNPAGLIGRCRITFDNGDIITATIDASWKASDDAPPGWNTATFDDSSWRSAMELARYGDAPWGRLYRDGQRTWSPVSADPFVGRFTAPSAWLAAGNRVVLEARDIQPEAAAAVTLNGQSIGGCIGRPLRLDLTARLVAGENTIRIEPFAPAIVRIARYSNDLPTASADQSSAR